MSIDTPTPSAPAPIVPPADGWTRRDRLAGCLLTATWLALLVAVLLVGERESTFGHLEEKVAAGEVREVEVVGDPLSGSSIGYAGVQVRWRESWVDRTASVTQASSERQAAKARRANGGPVIIGGVDDHLRRLDPDVSLSRGEHRSTSFSMGGLEGPGWIGFGYLLLLLGTLALVGGPRPWRASRWGWAWLALLLPPYGIGAYLLLGGPTGLFPPRNPRRVWLTGGWAFILALILGGSAAS